LGVVVLPLLSPARTNLHHPGFLFFLLLLTTVLFNGCLMIAWHGNDTWEFFLSFLTWEDFFGHNISLPFLVLGHGATLYFPSPAHYRICDSRASSPSAY
jgi:hypothetical protein